MSSYSYYCPEPTYLNKFNDNSGVIGLGALKGKITDKSTGEAIPFANIVLYQNEKQITGALSDIDGFYTVKPITTGKYDVKVSYVGYQSTQITGIYINADKITFQDIALAASNLSLQEVEIVNYKVPVIDANDVTSGATISVEEIKKMPGRSTNSVSSKTYGWASDKDEKTKIEEKNYVPNTTVYTATSFQYEIDLPYTIPADNKDYSVQIKEYKVPAIYEYSTAPRAITSAFLQANIVNWDEFNLMSGQANLYYEGTYLGNSYIDAKSVEDTMKISLGNDQSIIVKHERIKDFKSKKFLSSSVKESFGWEISIRNNKKEKITINVADQYPISTDKEITVELLESSGATIDEKKGTLTWKTDINPQETKKFVIKYTVKYPASYRMELE